MGTILSDADRTAICQRIGSVTSVSVPRWGRMDAKAMLTHWGVATHKHTDHHLRQFGA